MTAFKSDLIQVLTERGFIHQASDAEGLDDAAASGRIAAYVGYDCTGPSLHVGHLLSIMMLRWLQKAGHTPITLMGGGTTRVGDPSGKDQTRQLLSYEQIEANKQSLLKVFSRFLHYGDGPGDPNAFLAHDLASGDGGTQHKHHEHDRTRDHAFGERQQKSRNSDRDLRKGFQEDQLQEPDRAMGSLFEPDGRFANAKML